MTGCQVDVTSNPAAEGVSVLRLQGSPQIRRYFQELFNGIESKRVEMTSHVQSQDHLSKIGSKSSKLKASQNHLQHIASSHPSNPFNSHLKALLLKIFYCFFTANSETAGNCSCNTSRFQDRRHGWCRSNATKNHLPGATFGRFGCRTSRALMDLDGLWMHIGPIECRMYVAK